MQQLGRFFGCKCDTIAELSEKLGLPADQLEATVERYNELYDKGVDEDFGKEAHRMSAIRTAPFYGAKNTGYILCTIKSIQKILYDTRNFFRAKRL